MLLFHEYLETQFPLTHENLEKEIVSDLSLVYRWKGKDASINPALFLAHMDVVPVDESSESNWDFDAFSGAISEGYILGRGTMDDKGSVLSIMEATEQLLAEGITPEYDIYFAFGHDEEIGGEYGAVRIAEKFANEKRKFSFIIDEGLVVITDGLSGISKPIGLIGLAEKGAMSMTLTVKLENGGHAMMPPKETAITILSEALVNLKNNPPKVQFNESVDKMFANIGPQMKWPERLFFANQWLFKPLIANSLSKSNAANALIKTTLAPTIIDGGIMDNVLPSQATATINVRIVPGETVESVLAYVKKTIDDERISVSSEAVNKPRDPTTISPTDHIGFKSIQRSIYEVFGDVIVAPGLVIAGTDARHYGAVCDATYRFMPVMVSNKDLEGIHGVNEKLSIENYKNMVRFYQRLILNFK
ncbi:UNVERIFIED_CONTAM: hypothetical protein GTU68_027142 [Idotea baltica]|nr:hypothetical protein [Idotea baltica]